MFWPAFCRINKKETKVARKKLIRTSEFPYHVTTRTNNKEWFYAPLEKVWEYSVELLNEGCERFNIQIHSYVLMSNHYHLLVSTPEENIDKFMQFFNQKLGRKICYYADRINRTFGRPYHWSIVDNQKYFRTVDRYIYQNPVRSGEVTRCEDYPFSTIRQRYNLSNGTLKIALSDLFYESLVSLSTLNIPFSNDRLRIVKKAFKKHVYYEKSDRELLEKR